MSRGTQMFDTLCTRVLAIRKSQVFACAILLFSAGFSPIGAQTVRPHSKPTELVVAKYLKLVADGALLTREGWEKAGSLFVVSTPYVADSDIHLMSTGGSLGEMRMKDGRALVTTKWTDDFGTIDARLRYRPPEAPRPATTAFGFLLELTNKHWDTTGDELTSETVGPLEWKLTGPMRRETTVEKAIAYIAARSASTTDPRIRKNAERTLVALRQLTASCGNASAC
jgi:hypothetical protein